MMATYNLISEGRGANFNSNNSEKNELQRRIMKGIDRRSKKSSHGFFTGFALNKCKTVKTRNCFGELSHCLCIFF